MEKETKKTKAPKTAKETEKKIITKKVAEKKENSEDDLIINVSDIQTEKIIEDKKEEQEEFDIEIDPIDKKEDKLLEQSTEGLDQNFVGSDLINEKDNDPNEGEKEYEKLEKKTINDVRRVQDAGYREEKKKALEEQEKKKELDNPISIQIDNPKKVLSKTAAQWKAWLEYQKMTPEQFKEKYKNHKMIPFIEEIIEFNKK